MNQPNPFDSGTGISPSHTVQVLPIFEPFQMDHDESTLVSVAAEANAPLVNYRTSFLERFVSAFFHESNIKWMLFIGAAIVTVSSLKLVAQNWEDWSTTFKFISILGYVGIVYGFAESSGRMLGLRSTSTVLKVLTLILLPISFFSLSLLAADASQNIFSLAPLLIGGGVFTAILSDRILKEFLQGRQISFQSSYIALTIAGALPTSAGNPLTLAAVIWLIATIGIVKVNRHVFWLAEQHRKPLIYGFFPILLLGFQMVILFATKLNWIEQTEWLGFGLVLSAIPVMLTTRTVAKVFQARTGGLIKTLPLAIVIPTFVALSLGAAGVVLSFHGVQWVGPTTYAVVPTVALASCLAWIAAKDTQRSGFTWIAIVLMAISYQMAPTLVSAMAKQLVASAAQGLAEERLPVAFYGLTYIPLLLAWSVSSRLLINRKYFATPLQIAATTLSLLMLAIAVTHVKAAFLIPCIHAGLFLFYAILWQDRRYAWVSLTALTIAVGAVVPFTNSMFNASIDILHVGTALSLFGCGLMVLPIDRLLARLPHPKNTLLDWITDERTSSMKVARTLGDLLVAVIGAAWASYSIHNIGSPITEPQWIIGSITIIASVIAVLRSNHYAAGLALSVGSLLMLSSWIASTNWSDSQILDLVIYSSVSLSMIGYASIVSIRRTFDIDWRQERKQLGFDLSRLTLVPSHDSKSRDMKIVSLPKTLVQAFVASVIPLADIATLVVGILLAWQSAALINSSLFMDHTHLYPSCVALLGWLVFAISVTRSRIACGTLIATIPFMVSSFLQSNAMVPSDLRYSVLIWSTTVALFGVSPYILERKLRSRSVKGSDEHSNGVPSTTEFSVSTTCSAADYLTRYAPTIAACWCYILTAFSVCAFSIPTQLAGLVSLATLYCLYQPAISSKRFTFGAIFVNGLVWMLALPFVGIEPSDFMDLIFWSGASRPSAIHTLLVLMVANGLVVRKLSSRLHPKICAAWVELIRFASVALLLAHFMIASLPLWAAIIVAVACAIIAAEEFILAVRKQNEAHVWTSIGISATGSLLLLVHGYFASFAGIGFFVAMLGGLLLQWLSTVLSNRKKFQIASRPFAILGNVIPLAIASYGLVALFALPTNLPWLVMSIFAGAFAYAYQSWTTGNRKDAWIATGMVNIGIANLNRMYGFNDLQFYLVPIGISIIGLVELMKCEIPVAAHKPLRMIGSLCVLVSPVFQILSGSWWHMFSLLVLSVVVVLVAIGLRIKVVMFTGIAFLLADLLAMLVRSAIDHPNMLWVSGLAVGVTVMGVAAVCEIYRERLLSKMRYLSSELATWN